MQVVLSQNNAKSVRASEDRNGAKEQEPLGEGEEFTGKVFMEEQTYTSRACGQSYFLLMPHINSFPTPDRRVGTATIPFHKVTKARFRKPRALENEGLVQG